MSHLGALAKYRRLWALLPRPFSWAAVALVAASIVGSALEVLGIAILGLLLGELGSAGITPAVPGAGLLQHVPQGSGPQGRVYAILVLCAIVFLVKNLFLALHAWAEATFAYRLQAWISQRLIAESLGKSYEEASKRSPSEYTALLTTDLSALAHYTLLPSLTLLSETVLIFAMFAYLVSTQPLVTLVVGAVLLVGGLAMSSASRVLMARLGSRRQTLEDSRIRHLQQTFGNLKDVYIYGAARSLHAVLSRDMLQIAAVYRGYQMLSTGPRFLLESAMVAILLAIIAVGLQTHDRAALVASVGVFAASGFRFLISANRMMMSLQAMRFGEAALDRVWTTIGHSTESSELPAAVPPGSQGDWTELQASGVLYSHHGASAGIGPLDVRVRRGEIVGIVGASGVGKSTMLEILVGLRQPQTGSVVLRDARGGVHPVEAPGSRICLVGQSTAALAASLRDNVAFGLDRDAVGDDAIWEALKLAQMESFARGLPQQLETPLAEFGTSLSGGQLQRIGIARALCRKSSFMLLDEPTSALDPATEVELVRTLRRIAGRCGIVLVSHRSAPLQACDRVYELSSHGLRLLSGEDICSMEGASQ